MFFFKARPCTLSPTLFDFCESFLLFFGEPAWLFLGEPFWLFLGEPDLEFLGDDMVDGGVVDGDLVDRGVRGY